VINFIQILIEESAPGFDGISVNILKAIQNHIVKPLTFIFNVCLKQGIFPNKFKTAIIKPLYKSGNKDLVSNYRPISMMYNFSKIFEKIIKFRLMSYLETNKLLSNNQYGFRPGRSTTNALYSTTKLIYENLDKSLKVIPIFLDLAKAFDTVDHKILINILPNFGIKGKSLGWFSSYLHNRTQMVSLNNTASR